MPAARHRPKVLSVIGARPEIIQASRVSAALASIADEVLVHTGQHYDLSMSELQIVSTQLPNPDYNLEVGSRPDAEQLAIGEERLSALIESERPNAVVVRGDTNGTLSGARAAAAADVTLPPPLATANVVSTPATGFPNLSVTFTDGATGTFAPATAVCASPADFARVLALCAAATA